MRDDYEHSIPGLIGWLIILLVGFFLGTKALWFNQLHSADKALFWTNIAVAAGTLALAAVTWWNVRQTTLVLAGDDRRHQQTYAPLVELYGPGYGEPTSFQVRNIGNGIAVNVSLTVDGKLTKKYVVETEITEEQAQEVLAKEGQIQTTVRNGTKYRITQEPRTTPFRALYLLPALKNEPEKTDLPYQEFYDAMYSMIRVEYVKIQLTYSDMFGNKYATLYDTDSLQYYEWKQPKNLAIPK